MRAHLVFPLLRAKAGDLSDEQVETAGNIRKTEREEALAARAVAK